MQLQSTRFGDIEIDPDSVIFFPEPILGFDQSRRYKLFHEDKQTPVMLWLQSLDEADVVFSLIDPTMLGLHFEIILTDDECTKLAITDPSSVAVLLMVAKDGDRLDPKPYAPILINVASRIGMQKPGVRANIVFSNV
ncbi:flagellar assembly factor FliW [Chitinivorax tropicus]|uniref:Flagellar assembly factor FliW n=1 Tax=Chitinivorax tropicus TaxID=714531 RepID=A0A840MVQ8_9PROT|nr:flagellar assembly protein FliW [Chitinivorax tropicus]MBB5020443.1 flagellar assembly factor FliW [Chitinivorax tropicus]